MVDFFANFLRLYEGEKAGQPFTLIPWAEDALRRIFGWVKPSEFFGREVRRFRKASIWVPKKNGKSPVGAGVGLYLLCADGEQGQKVFSAAKDGKQAGIIHTHARKMVEMSPALSEVCRINKSTGRITHEPSSSFYDVLSGDNITGQEGLNGSVIVDEVHVIDARLASTLEHMGASRSEPLQFEISTAGNDPLSYGKRQYDYGKMVERGDAVDDSFFFACWEAKQDAGDEELEDPEIWKAANPSWGYTINAEEFADSFQRAKRSPNDWINFKKYRLNIWATGENPWLRIDDWNACREDFTDADLKGLPCWGGLDLAKTRDLTALTMVFRDDTADKYYLRPHYWLPEKRADEINHSVPMREWAKRGFVTLTPGDVCDYTFVAKEIGELDKRFRILILAFDPYNAEQLTQQLENEYGIPRVSFGQTITNFADPTKEFERLVVSRGLAHNGHPVLTWQAGHVNVKSDANNNIRPVKQKHGDVRTIDGIVAGIMGLAQARLNAGQQLDFYEHNAVEIG